MRLLLCVLLITLSGCASDLETASLAITGEGIHVDQEQRFAPHTRPTAPLYEAHGKAHPGAYSLHDLLFEWADHDHHDLETEFYDGGFGYGFALCAIDGFPPAQANGEARGCFERGGFWAVSVDGAAAEVGMSDIVVQNGNSFMLEWTPLEGESPS